MAEFINTVEIVGDDALIDSIIQKTITEFKDIMVNSFGQYAFYQCTALEMVDLPSVTSISQNAFAESANLRIVVLRNANTVVTLGNANAFSSTTIVNNRGCIFVPSSLLESYKIATNWSTYSDRIRAIEDYSRDGTVDGEVVYFAITNTLTNVSTDNDTVDMSFGSYRATLTSIIEEPISEIIVTMGGVDVTAEVYNPETGEIYIPEVTGNLNIRAIAFMTDDSLPELPDGYTAVHSISTRSTKAVSSVTNGPYINTDVYPSSTISIECKLAMLGTATDVSYSGAVASDNKGWVAMGSYGDSKLSAFFCSSSRNGSSIPFDNNFHTYSLSNGCQGIDGANNTYITASPSFPTNARLYLLSHWMEWTANPTHNTASALAWCKIWDNGVPIRYYQPCVRDSDGEAGLYDLVAGEFVGNSGTGSFTVPQVLFIEQGTLDWQNNGVEKDLATSIRTDFIPFDGSANVSLAAQDSSTYRVTLRGYDSNKVYKASNGQWTTFPGTISYNYPYLRLIIGKIDGSELDVWSLHGSILTVDGVEYTLVVGE